MIDWQKYTKKIDFALIAATVGLACISLLVLYGIGSESSTTVSYAKKQLIWIVAGLAIMAAVAFFNYGRLRAYTIIIYSVNVFTLVAIFVIGKMALGAQRWIQVGSFSFQPSEFSKLMIIITLGAFLAERKGSLESWRDTLGAIVHVAPAILLIMFQPDLGTALVLIAILVGMLFVGGIKLKHLLVLSVAAYAAIGVVFKLGLFQAYQLKRLVVFVNPEIDPLGSGYNLRQSIISIGSGEIFGKGLFSGTQSRLNFLPTAVRHTDFIFSVIGEELGFLGGLALITLILFLLARTLRIASVSRSYFGVLVATGIASMWTFQVLVNIGMTIGIMPITGIPLPFISYGGSSMLMNTAAVGLLLSIYGRRWI